MVANNFFSGMHGSVRWLIMLALGGVVIATFTFFIQRRAHQQITELQTSPPTAYSGFNRRILHDDPELDLALHRLRDSPSIDNLVASHELLVERATDPNNSEDQLAWSWFVSVIGKHAEIQGNDTDIWAWFQTDVISETNNILAADVVRQLSICVLRQHSANVPTWMIVNETDAQLASNTTPLGYEGEGKSFAEIDAELTRPAGEDR